MGKASRNLAKRAAEHYGPYRAPQPKFAPVARGATKAFRALGSARARNVVTGRCHICGDESHLEYGHVLPRWATKDWAGTEGAVATTWDMSSASPVRDGQRFYMLCGTCERRIGEGEGLLKRLQRDEMRVLEKNGLHLARGNDGLWRVGGRKLEALHRGLLGIALKLAITDDRPGREVSRPRLAKARTALSTDDYSGHPKPFAVLMQPVGGGETWKEQHVVAGVSATAARFTIGRFHWVVPYANDPTEGSQDLGWILIEHEVNLDDPKSFLWIEDEDFRPRDVVALALRNARQLPTQDPRRINFTGAERPAP